MPELKIFSHEFPVKDKRIIVRLDLNVPIKNSKIEDDTRIRLVVPFLQQLLKNNAKIILISHLGRPKGKLIPELSLKPIHEYLKIKLNKNINFFIGKIDSKAFEASRKLKSGEILLLENIRFFKEEGNDEENFAKNLANLGDIFINEAFSCSHRKQASIHKITKYIESYGGPLLEKEIQSINLIIKNKKEPVTAIIGGSKVSTKIGVLSNLIKNINNLVIVGAMANNFIKFNGNNVGKSLVEKDTKEVIEKVNDLAKKNDCKIIVPIDCVVSQDFNGEPLNKSLHEITNDQIILDIGEKTVGLINDIIEKSKTVFWNGPAGYYENEKFSKGTLSIANKIAENTKKKTLISIVGGGDTVAAIKNTELGKLYTHLSTAGGAFLESLEGKELPGIKVIKKNNL